MRHAVVLLIKLVFLMSSGLLSDAAGKWVKESTLVRCEYFQFSPDLLSCRDVIAWACA